MQQSEYDQFVEVMNSVADAVGNRRPTEMGITVYWKVLEGYSLESVQLGITSHLRDPDVGQFMPKPADIIRHLEGSGDEQSLRAWQTVEETVKRIGPYRAVIFEDRATHAAVEQIGGYSALCRATLEDWPFIRNNFCKLYRGMKGRPMLSNPVPMIAESDGGEKPLLIKSGKGPLLLEVSDAA